MVRLTAALNKLIAIVAVCSLQTVLLGASANIDDPLKGNLDDQSLQIHKPLNLWENTSRPSTPSIYILSPTRN